ncbi:hypothetical protein GpartN1_g528.t1 [Galdieria partita]|uniref:Uncharacterized protein n=1 Tax=Galdieria partita TaxID=83374 RepID=A0A9C7UML7_9RHOD|nr:hypothetical protein GpartN1_g528.t1 [Galdieria partita]
MSTNRKLNCGSSKRTKTPKRNTHGAKGFKRFSVLHENFLQYLFELYGLFQAELEKQKKRLDSLPNNSTLAAEDDIDDDNLSLLKNTFLKEVSGKELSCLCDIRTAQMWEIIQTQFNLEDFSFLLSRQCFVVAENIQSILFDKTGSRIFEQLITRCLFLCHQSGIPSETETSSLRNEKLAGLDKFWKQFVKSICSDSSRFIAVICDCNASHVLRSFLLGAVGFMKDGRVVDEAEILRGAQHLDNVNSYFMSLVQSIWDTVDNSYEKISHHAYLSHVHASLVLQSLLFTKVSMPTLQSVFLNQLYDFITSRECNNENNFRKMACHDVTSHLLESFVYSMEDGLFQELFDAHLRNQIPFLSYDKYGNHVLQQIIRKQKDIPKVLDVYDKLESNINDLVAIGHYGVLAALAEALLPCEVRAQRTYVRRLAKALNCTGKTSCDLVRNLLYPSETARANFVRIAESISGGFETLQDNDLDKIQRKAPRCSLVGSLLVQYFLKYAPPGRQLVEESFVRFERSQLFLIALDPSGSRAVEGFLSSCENFSLLNRFIDKFSGFYSLLAKDCYGFHVLLRMFKVSDVKGKKKLVEELAATRLWLASFPYGNEALVRLKVYEFIRRQEQWSRKETTMENRKRLFKDILEADISEYEKCQKPSRESKGQTKKKRNDKKDVVMTNTEDKSEDAQLELILESIRNVSS